MSDKTHYISPGVALTKAIVSLIFGVILGLALDRSMNPYGSGHNQLIADCQKDLPRNQYCEFELKAVPVEVEDAP